MLYAEGTWLYALFEKIISVTFAYLPYHMFLSQCAAHIFILSPMFSEKCLVQPVEPSTINQSSPSHTRFSLCGLSPSSTHAHCTYLVPHLAGVACRASYSPPIVRLLAGPRSYACNRWNSSSSAHGTRSSPEVLHSYLVGDLHVGSRNCSSLALEPMLLDWRIL
jgi:hypothetical protein